MSIGIMQVQDAVVMSPNHENKSKTKNLDDTEKAKDFVKKLA